MTKEDYEKSEFYGENINNYCKRGVPRDASLGVAQLSDALPTKDTEDHYHYVWSEAILGEEDEGFKHDGSLAFRTTKHSFSLPAVEA